MIISPPKKTESFGYFDRYINKVPYKDLIKGFDESYGDFFDFIDDLPEETLNFRYQPDKWTIKEIIGHIIDCERVFAYRAMRFGRGDKTPLPGFDENEYAKNSNAGKRNIDELVVEFADVRDATESLFLSFDEEMLDSRGKANDIEVSVRALGFMIVGHQLHHLEIIKERYIR